MKDERTSNIEHRILNFFHSMFDVGRSMFDVNLVPDPRQAGEALCLPAFPSRRASGNEYNGIEAGASLPLS